MIFLDDTQYLFGIRVGCLNALFKYTGSYPCGRVE